MTRGTTVNRTRPNGLTQTEQDVLDRWDGGMSAENISRELGIGTYRVKGILSTFVGRPDDWEAAARESTAALAAAIRLHHPEQLRSAA